MKHTFPVYLLVMSLITYAVRAVPFTLFGRKVRNSFFRSFLYYIPYTVLAAMTFPGILYATSSILPAAVGTVTAISLAIKGRGLITVSLSACLAALLVGWFM